MKKHALNAAGILAVGFFAGMIYVAATTDDPAERQGFVDMMSAADPDWKFPAEATADIELAGNSSGAATNTAEN